MSSEKNNYPKIERATSVNAPPDKYTCNTVQSCQGFAISEGNKRKKWMYASAIIGIISISTIAGILLYPKPVIPTYRNILMVDNDFYVAIYDNGTFIGNSTDYTVIYTALAMVSGDATQQLYDFLENLTVGEFRAIAEYTQTLRYDSLVLLNFLTLANVTKVNSSVYTKLETVFCAMNTNYTIIDPMVANLTSVQGIEWNFTHESPAIISGMGGFMQYKNNGTTSPFSAPDAFSPFLYALQQSDDKKVIDYVPFLFSNQNNTVKFHGITFNATAGQERISDVDMSLNGKKYPLILTY